MTATITRKSTRNRRFLAGALVATFAAIALLAGGSVAKGQGGQTFGIGPADAAAGPYFIYTLDPGASKSDKALVSNYTGAAMTLQAFAADAVTATGGGTAFGARGEKKTGVGEWISMNQGELNLAPGAAVSVPVTVTVPAGTHPGDYVAGLVVQAPPKAGAVGNVSASVTERAGVAILVHVPGATKEKLAIGTACFNQETGSRYFEVPVKNQGDILTAAAGTFKLETEAGERVFDRPVELGAVIPTLDTVFRVDSPQDPPPGKYVAKIALTQKDGEEVKRDSKVSIPDQKVNGCKVEAETRTIDNSGDNFNVKHSQSSEATSGTSLTVVGLSAALVLMAIVLLYVLWRTRKLLRHGGA